MLQKRNRTGSLSGIVFLVLSLLIPGVLTAQMDDSGISNGFPWRNIGPANMGGRVADIEALDDDFATVYVGAACGGIFRSYNAGTTWEPIFETYSTASIGDIAIYQKDPDIIYVGTGEGNVRNSVSWGDGMYKSTDAGDTWEQIGLKGTHHISRVVIHPDNPDIVYVAAQGHLWGEGGERGLYKTENGGRTWTKLANGLPSSPICGAVDVVINPKKPNTLIVGMWERLRQPHRFDSGGPNGGLFKTTDGGKSWKKLTNGLPEGDSGRIGLSIYREDPNIVMAMYEHSDYQGRQRGGGAESEEYNDLSNLGTGVYRSEDGGETWKLVNRYNNRPFYYSQIRINPSNDQDVWLATTQLMHSEDGGAEFNRAGPGIHVDFHAMWIDPKDENRHYTGSDGGVSLSHDGGETYDFLDNFAISQFYAVSMDMRDPYYVYGGLQDNGTWGAPSNSRDRSGILNDHWVSYNGGDGFYAEADPNDWRIVYQESQGGNIARWNIETQQSSRIRPSQQNILNYDDFINEDVYKMNQEAGYRGETAFRFNWNSPILISPHNSNTIYFSGNHVFKSVDRGDHWLIVSPDLSTKDPVRMNRETGGITSDVTGAETNTTVITISENHVKPGILWAGTDDGLVHVTKDDGRTWTNVTRNIPGVPQGLFVSRIDAGHFDEGTAYVTFDGHRSDEFRPWAFKTTDFGATWTKITGGIPNDHVCNVIREDLRNPNLLFIGTEKGLFVSTNGGGTFEPFMNELPVVAVDDIKIHPRDNDLVIATHSRGIWICDDISPLQQLTDDVIAAGAHLFDQRRFTNWLSISRGGSRGAKFFQGENPGRFSRIDYYFGEGVTSGTLEITDLTGKMKRTVELDGEPGVNYYQWNFMFDAPELTAEEQEIEQKINDTEDREEQMELTNQLRESLDNRGAIYTMGRGGRGGARGGFGGGTRGLISGPRAGVGTYRLTLMANGKTVVKTFEVRNDPMLKN